MPPRPQSRIEVDLKILQDKNAERLVEFGKQFDASVTRLADALKQEVEHTAEAAVQRAGQVSPTASHGAVITSPAARMGGTWERVGGGYAFANTPSGTGGGTTPPGSGPSIAPGPDGQPIGVGGHGTFEQQYVRAQKRIGEVPVGLRQFLGYYAEGGPSMDDQGRLLDGAGNVMTDDNGDPMYGPSSRRYAGKVNTWLFQAQAVRSNVALGYGHLQNMFASVAAPTALGQQLGRSREGGLLGTGLFSSAFWTGVSENFKAMAAGDFGFNPNYTPAQAKAARQALESFGYSGDTGDILAEQMKQLEIHQQLPPEMVMQFLDPYMRYGGFQSGEQLINVLRSIPEAAKAASFNLKTFTDQLASTALQVAQQTGMQPGQVASALASFSATTGLSPERGASLFTQQNIVMGAALTGKSITSLMENPNAAPEMQFGLRVFQSMTGGLSAEQLLSLRRSNYKQYESIMNGVYLAYLNNKDIFGGLSPREIMNMQARNRGRTVQHTAVDQAIRDMSLGQGSVNNIQRLISGYGPHSADLVRQFEAARSDYLRKHVVRSSSDLQTFRAAMRDQALAILGVNQKKQGQRAAYEITLSGEAKRMFKLLEKNTGQEDTPNRNQLGSWWRQARNFENNPLPGLEKAGRGIEHAGEAFGHAILKGTDAGLDPLGL